jgi:integrase
VTFGQYAHQWSAARPVRDSTRRRVESYLRHHVDPTHLATRRIADVRPSEVQAWVTDRSRVLAPSTLRVVEGYVRSIFACAVRDRLVGVSPALDTKRPKVTRRKRLVPLSIPEVIALAEVMPERYRAMVLVQAGLGLRVGELLALRVQDVDFLRRTVEVEAQIDQDTHERVDCKTVTSHRTVPLPQVVADALAAHLSTYPVAGPDAPIFTSGRRSGLPVTRQHYNALLHQAATAAGVPDVTSHSLRHHYASVMLAAGESVLVVAERLGHDDGGSLVLRTYGHLLPDAEDRSRAAIDRAWGAAAGAPRVSRAPSVPRIGGRQR